MTFANLSSYGFLLLRFRNWLAAVQNLRHGAYQKKGPVLEELHLRNGQRVVHPHRGGLVPTMLEIWHENTYRIGEFYAPQPGDVVVDIGAHVGLFSLSLSSFLPFVRPW